MRTGGDRPRTRSRPGLVRDPQRGYTGGLCQAVAQRYGIDPMLVRVLAIVLALSSGLGVGLYVTVWSLTPAVNQRDAPLDRILPGARRWGPTSVLVYAVTITGVVVILVGQVTPLGWWPAIVLLLAWLAVRHLGRQPTVAARPAGLMGHGRGGGRALSVVTWASLLVAGLAAVAAAASAPRWTTLSRLLCGAAAALLVVGLGLVVGSRWGLSRILRSTGIVLGAVVLSLDAPYLVVSSASSRATTLRYADAAALPSGPLVIHDAEARIDLSALQGAQPLSVSLQASNAVIHLITPAGRPVQISFECTAAQVRIPGASGCSGMGSGHWSRGGGTGGPLQIYLNARGSDVQVTP